MTWAHDVSIFGKNNFIGLYLAFPDMMAIKHVMSEESDAW